MARPSRPADSLSIPALTMSRAVHLYQLFELLGSTPLTREMLTKKLRRNVRAFYRDLNLLRACGIDVVMRDRKYSLKQNINEARELLPLPDPRLRLGEAAALAKGTSSGHRKIKETIDKLG